MSASLDRAREECEAALERLEPLFTSDCKLTLVMRSTTNKDAFFVLSGDDLGAIEHLLARARGVVARGSRQWRNQDLVAAVALAAVAPDDLGRARSAHVKAILERDEARLASDRFEARALRADEVIWKLLTVEQLRAAGFADVADSVEKARRG